MVSNLELVFKEIFDGVKTLDNTSIELSNISGELSSSSEMTSKRSSTVASAAEDMSGNINAVATSIEDATSNVSSVEGATGEMISRMNKMKQMISFQKFHLHLRNNRVAPMKYLETSIRFQTICLLLKKR
jgi:methyl-accepting chemotaxis protein